MMGWDFDNVDKLMVQALQEGVFPGAVLLAAREGSIAFFDSYGYTNLFTRTGTTTDTVFDLASLTKALATTPALMLLVQQHRLELDQPIESWLPWLRKTDKATIPLRALLNHTSGFPAYRPFYMELASLPFDRRGAALKVALANILLEHPVGEASVYSDLGFLLLGYLVEEISGRRLDRYVSETIYTPLGISATREPRICFVDLEHPEEFENVAATEICRWRNRLLEGCVHDENAFALGGIAGHAGLFGDAYGVFTLAQELLTAWRGGALRVAFDPQVVHAFFKRNSAGERPLGFDAPAEKDASCGGCFSFNTVGHLGFTGTSFWIDLDRALIVILLSNRVHPGRGNQRIKFFRPRLHDAVMRVLVE